MRTQGSREYACVAIGLKCCVDLTVETIDFCGINTERKGCSFFPLRVTALSVEEWMDERRPIVIQPKRFSVKVHIGSDIRPTLVGAFTRGL